MKCTIYENVSIDIFYKTHFFKKISRKTILDLLYSTIFFLQNTIQNSHALLNKELTIFEVFDYQNTLF